MKQNSASAASAAGIYIEPDRFGVKNGSTLTPDPARTIFKFVRDGDALTLQLSITFKEDPDSIAFGEKTVNFGGIAAGVIDLVNNVNPHGLGDFKFRIDSLSNDALRFQSLDGNYDLRAIGDKREHGHTAI